jgi:hypothetical protein
MEMASPKLAGDRFVFFANVSSADDLTGILNEYEYDISTGTVRHVRCIQPDPIWETDKP